MCDSGLLKLFCRLKAFCPILADEVVGFGDQACGFHFCLAHTFDFEHGRNLQDVGLNRATGQAPCEYQTLLPGQSLQNDLNHKDTKDTKKFSKIPSLKCVFQNLIAILQSSSVGAKHVLPVLLTQ
jgi:hypothetical protein